MAAAIPDSRTVLVGGGHLIDPSPKFCVSSGKSSAADGWLGATRSSGSTKPTFPPPVERI